MVGRERAQRVPGNLRVVMAMVVDKARGHSPPCCVDRPFGRPAQFAEFGNLAVLDTDIAPERRHPRAVDDAPVFDQQIIRHRFPFLRSVATGRSFAELYHYHCHVEAICRVLADMRFRVHPSAETADFGPEKRMAQQSGCEKFLPEPKQPLYSIIEQIDGRTPWPKAVLWCVPRCPTRPTGNGSTIGTRPITCRGPSKSLARSAAGAAGAGATPLSITPFT